MKPHSLHVSIACLALVLFAASPLRAQVLYSTDFEDPPFTPGPINGQDGWSNNGTIQSSTAYAGSQALRLDASGGSQYAKRFPGYAFAGRVLDFSVYFLRTGNTSPAAGLSLTGDTGFLAQLTSSSGGKYYLGNANSNTTQVQLSEGVWHKLELKLDFIALTIEAWVDGTSVGTLPVDNATSSVITIVQIGSEGTGGPASDVYADNFTMVDATAPIYSTGFEDPPFVLGPISGQDGWSVNGTIQNGTVFAGSQALHLDASGVNQGAGRSQGYAVTGKVMDFTMEFLRTGDLSPQAGLALSGDTGFISQLVSVSGGLYYLGNTNSNTPPALYAENVWHRLVLRMDFIALTMQGWVDGDFLGALPINNATPPSTITIVQVFTGGTGGPASDVYVDDFTMTDITNPLGVGDQGPLSAHLEMGPARPNPFRDGVSFAVDLPRPERITLTIYDVRGRVLARLADGTLAAGRHSFHWDGRDGAHHQSPNGVYFAQVRGEGMRLTRRAILLR